MRIAKFCQRLCSCQEHSIGHPACLANQDPESYAREDEYVIALANDMTLAVELNRFKRRTGSYQGASFGMNHRLRGSAFGFAGRITQREDDGTFAPSGHRLNDGRRKVARLTGRANEDGR